MTDLNRQKQNSSCPVESDPGPRKDDKRLRASLSLYPLKYGKKESPQFYRANLITPCSSLDRGTWGAGLSSVPFLVAFEVLELKNFCTPEFKMMVTYAHRPLPLQSAGLCSESSAPRDSWLRWASSKFSTQIHPKRNPRQWYLSWGLSLSLSLLYYGSHTVQKQKPIKNHREVKFC